MSNKASFTIAEVKQVFPEYGMLHSDEPAPTRASFMLPRAMFATLDFDTGVLTTSIEASWDSDKRIEFTSHDEADAQRAIASYLLPDWKAAGFEPTGERGFDDDTPGAEAVYSVTLKKTIQTLDDLKQAFQCITVDAETLVRV